MTHQDFKADTVAQQVLLIFPFMVRKLFIWQSDPALNNEMMELTLSPENKP